MTHQKRTAKTLLKILGVQPAIMRAQAKLASAMKGGSMQAIEQTMFWREVLVEIMAEKGKQQ